MCGFVTFLCALCAIIKYKIKYNIVDGTCYIGTKTTKRRTECARDDRQNHLVPLTYATEHYTQLKAVSERDAFFFGKRNNMNDRRFYKQDKRDFRKPISCE